MHVNSKKLFLGVVLIRELDYFVKRASQCVLLLFTCIKPTPALKE